jgi:hypothetical protein
VIVAAVAVFIALFATIYIQMAMGKDPALGSSTSTARVGTTSTDSATSTSSSSDDDDEDDDSSSGAMTTAQS